MKIPFTREHGAYGMAITTFVIGAGIGGNLKLWTLTTLLALILFIMAKFPLSILLQGRNIDRAMKKQFVFWAFVFIHTGFLLALPLLKNLQSNKLFFAVTIVLAHIILYFLFVLVRKERTVLAEVAGISAICISGILGYLSSGGEDIKSAVLIWIIPLLYYTASIFKVRSLILKEEREFFKRINLLYPLFCSIIVLFMAVMNFVQYSVLLCLLPLVENILVNFKKERVDIRRTGWIEVAKSAIFGIILIFTLR
jgi:hypothetical protein